MSKDLIITSIHRYGFDQIKNWVSSIEMCGFDGLKAAVVYDLNDSVKNELLARDFILFQADLSGHIAEKRFWDMYAAIKMLQSAKGVDYVFCVDARDLVFQSNPSYYVDRIDHPSMIFSSEGVTHEQEQWNKEIMLNAYGQMVYDHMKGKDVLNAGVIAGQSSHVIDLMLSICLLNLSGKISPSDQAAYNITAHSMLNDPSFPIATDRDAWATNLHVKVHGGKEVAINEKSLLVNEDGTPYCIVHQYDRSQELTQLINSKYGI